MLRLGVGSEAEARAGRLNPENWKLQRQLISEKAHVVRSEVVGRLIGGQL